METLIAATFASFVMVPTRKVPWVLVFSVIGAIAVIGYLLLLYVFQDFGELVLSGAQYFVRTKLFRPFQSTKRKGLGIGLFHSQMILKAHHGQIEVESQPGVGTVFRVVLPLNPAGT